MVVDQPPHQLCHPLPLGVRLGLGLSEESFGERILGASLLWLLWLCLDGQIMHARLGLKAPKPGCQPPRGLAVLAIVVADGVEYRRVFPLSRLTAVHPSLILDHRAARVGHAGLASWREEHFDVLQRVPGRSD